MISNRLHNIADKQAKKKSRQYKQLSHYVDNLPIETSIEDLIKAIDRNILLEETITWYRLYRKTRTETSRAHTLPRRAYRRTKTFYQRGKRGYAEEDVWSLDVYLARVISAATADLRDISHGFPTRNEWNGLTPDQAYSQWQRELTMLSESFAKYHASHDKYIDPDAFKRFAYNFYDLWD